MMLKAGLLLTFALMTLAGMRIPAAAQEQMPREDDIRNHPWYVFLERGVDNSGLDRLIFVDMLTGDEVEVEVYGERYTLLRRSVLFYDRDQREVRVVTPDGALRAHPFIRMESGDRRVDWVVAPDFTQIAWTRTFANSDGRLLTETHIANIDGAAQRMIFEDGPYDDVRALPFSASPDFSRIYMDGYHLDNISLFTPFDQYASITALDVETGTYTPLPDEPSNCICGAEFGRGLFLRLRLSEDLQGFDLHVYNLQGGVSDVISALNLSNYTTGGDILISPDGTRAVYALARVTDFGMASQSIQTVFVLVDLQNMTQRALTNPITTFVRPVAWTEDNAAIILTSPTRPGTWKIALNNGNLERIAEATYLGTLNDLID